MKTHRNEGHPYLQPLIDARKSARPATTATPRGSTPDCGGQAPNWGLARHGGAPARPTGASPTLECRGQSQRKLGRASFAPVWPTF